MVTSRSHRRRSAVAASFIAGHGEDIRDHRWHTRQVAAHDIDDYLAGLDEPKRSTLRQVRQAIRDVIPAAEECISYGMPAFKIKGKTVAGFAAFTSHLSYLPHSGSVLSALADDLTAYQRTTGSLHFAIDEPLPLTLINKLINTRLEQLGLR